MRAVPEDSRSESQKLVVAELRLAAQVRANGGDPWKPAPALGTLLRLARLNVQAALRKAKGG